MWPQVYAMNFPLGLPQKEENIQEEEYLDLPKVIRFYLWTNVQIDTWPMLAVQSGDLCKLDDA